ncbi:MAG: tRNA (N6-isopentenyl adenosine(37)-C2)-methylthiotransferase MiaB, partial [Alphaproteobacteria bacterium]|nr:tRNA (N6-isopentenyl adenosine(37)-C2)-methylthiotransferase MiaB [Alphaproteobacteria bacterium]
MKTFYIQTFGCQMNVYDGQRIKAMLITHGLIPTDDLTQADIIILNTCAVREKASNKVFSALGRIRDTKKSTALFGIVGCVAQAEGANSFRRIPELNFVLGPQSYHKLPEILKNPDAKLLNIDLSGLEKFDVLPPISESSSLAYIPIQEGCDHCCTYCIVPFTRGREISRPFEDVMNDVYAAAENGAVEICFLGQNVNGYKNSLAKLIEKTATLPQIQRIRFTSSYPTEMTDDLIKMFEIQPKLLPFLNMPIQSGSQNVLTRMNRPYSLNLYIDIIEKLRAARPDLQISSDFIVGFPGETDNDFEQTIKIVKRVRYINSYSFKYSPRPHTGAALMPDQIPENIKKQRLAKLDGLLTEINRQFNESCIGKTMECLIEGPDKTGKYLLARSPYMQ